MIIFPSSSPKTSSFNCPKKITWMKHGNIFSGENKNNVTQLSSAPFAQRKHGEENHTICSNETITKFIFLLWPAIALKNQQHVHAENNILYPLVAYDTFLLRFQWGFQTWNLPYVIICLGNVLPLSLALNLLTTAKNQFLTGVYVQ